MEAALPGVRVLAGARLLSPVAIGRRTVCVPAVSFPTLSEAQQAGVMAHELSHLKRYDPYWIGFAEWLAALAPHGFVLRLIVFRMRRDSELLCDAAAARSSQSPASLVEALSIFVRDLETAGRVPVHVGYADSPILDRAYRLLYGPMETARPDHWIWAILIAMSVLVATAPRATLVSAPALNVRRSYWVDQAGNHYEVVEQLRKRATSKLL